jgi:hypothetical protein
MTFVSGRAGTAGRERLPMGVHWWTGAGAPAANFQAGRTTVGSIYTDTTAGKLYICTATDGATTATWVSVGSQT